MSRTVLELLRKRATVPLQGVEIEASLRDLLVEVRLAQTYRNVEDESIEAVFTFPVPRDALLLDVELELGERRLRGQVVARGTARESYEDAVTDGDTAVLLEELEPGLYHLSLGNLQPGETAVLRYRYAQLLYWHQGLRFALPTTLAPRYGDPAASGLDPVQQPGVDLTVSYPFSFRMRVEGRLAAAQVDSPTHAIEVSRSGQTLAITLADGKDTLDRDLVLTFALEASPPPAAVTARDGDRWVALATLPLPPAGDHEDQAPHCIPILVDCSSSMLGDSIAQARKALGRILDTLRPQDHFNVIRFGSRVEPLFPAPQAASKEALAAARALVEHMDADLGGTEIGQALEAAFEARPRGFAAQDVLLITDGEVWNAAAFVERARASGDRVFTVGVGQAVSEAFLRELADQTHGACELITPREDIGARIERHFRRIYQPRLESPRITWPTTPERQTPERLEGIYLGDTLHLFAWFAERPEGRVEFTATAGEDTALRLAAETQPAEALAADTLPRLAARAGLAELPESDRAHEAERYQLLTDQTAWLIVAQRAEEERSDGVPALRKVPHMLAAGWGGLGVEPILEDQMPASPLSYELEESMDYVEWGPDVSPESQRDDGLDLDTVVERFSNSFDFILIAKSQGKRSLEPILLHVLGLPKACIEELMALIGESDADANDVIACFLAELLHAHRDAIPSRDARRALRIYEKWARRLPEPVRTRVRQIVDRHRPDDA